MNGWEGPGSPLIGVGGDGGRQRKGGVPQAYLSPTVIIIWPPIRGSSSRGHFSLPVGPQASSSTSTLEGKLGLKESWT